MRRVLAIAMVVLGACSDGDGTAVQSLEIVDPAAGATLTGAVVLTVHGVHLESANQLKVTVDTVVQQMSSFDNTYPTGCADCMFTVSLTRVPLVNGSRKLGISLTDQTTGDISATVTVTIARP